MREVKIVAVMNGYIAVVGCQTLVFETRERLLNELARYLADPEGVEREYTKRYPQNQLVTLREECEPRGGVIGSALGLLHERGARHNAQVEPTPYPPQYRGEATSSVASSSAD